MAEGTPSEIKRRTSRLSVVEIQMRAFPDGLVERLRSLPGVSNVTTTPDGMLHRIVVQATPDPRLRERITALLDEGAVESVLEREPTLEEAYLRILA